MAIEAHSTVVELLNEGARDLERMGRKHILLDIKMLQKGGSLPGHLSHH